MTKNRNATWSEPIDSTSELKKVLELSSLTEARLTITLTPKVVENLRKILERWKP